MKQIGLGSYRQRLTRAAATLLDHQGFDGGWGLTLTSVSSIVNTSEALTVLRAAGVGGKPVRDALAYLAESISGHCRPRQKGGRGENTRFVCFGLAGLLRYPEFFGQPGIADTAAWCVDWLERHQVEDGWPEVAGIDDTSLHQTALAVSALTRLRHVTRGLGPDLLLPGGVNTTALLERAVPLVRHGLRGILYHRRSSGAWGWRTYVDTAPSPSKTALCLVAVADAVASGDMDAEMETGGAGGRAGIKRLPDVTGEAAGWLVRNHHRWETFVEDDKDVQGTTWEHLAYALAVRAVLRAGGDPRDARLAKTWRLMSSLWDDEAGLWNEPAASGGRATIRAAFATVCAYEEARARITDMSLASEEPHGKTVPAADGMLEVVRTLAADPPAGRLTVSADGIPVQCAVPRRLAELAALLMASELSVAEIAAAMFVAPSSVAKYVQRLNEAVTGALGGRNVKLVTACRTPRGAGYRMADRAASTG